MAQTFRVDNVQLPKLCELCETDADIKWWCVQCKSYMCEKCKKIHMKVQSSTQHEIVDIHIQQCRSLQDIKPKIITDNIPCQNHESKVTCLYCERCDRLVCPDCISTTHVNHSFRPIEEILEQSVDKLLEIESRFCRDLIFHKAKTQQNKKRQTQCNLLLDETIAKIQLQENHLIDKIKKYSMDLQTEVEQKRTMIMRVISEIKLQTENSEKKIFDNQSKIQKSLSSNQGKNIFEVLTEFAMPNTILNVTELSPEIKYFAPGDETSTGVVGMFGSLRKAKLPPVVLDIDFEIIKSYTSQPNQIITVDEKTAWILDLDKEVIQRVNIQGDALGTIQEIPSKIIDMALTPYNDILLSAWEQSDVKILTKSREIQMYFSVSPLLPYGIHVTKENDVIVGLVEYGAKFPLRDQSTRAVVIYGKDKKQKKCYEYDQNKQRLFNFPFRITTNVNNDILVIDRLSDRIGRVVGLKGRDGLRWTYEGNPQVNARKPFDPWGIVTTTMGQIIVSDCDNHALHVLSVEGDILVCNAKTNMGICYPFPLSIDRRGQLWVGCNKGAQTTDAKLHIVKLLY